MAMQKRHRTNFLCDQKFKFKPMGLNRAVERKCTFSVIFAGSIAYLRQLGMPTSAHNKLEYKKHHDGFSKQV
jgi:hypothetical protein